MITDARLLVSDAQALTATAVSTDAIPLNVAGVDLGKGEPMVFAFNVDVAADATTGDETYEFQIVTATNANLTTNQDIITAEAIARATLTAGYRFALPIPVNRVAATATHIGVRYLLGGTTPTITMTANLMPQSFFDEPEGVIRSGFTVAA